MITRFLVASLAALLGVIPASATSSRNDLLTLNASYFWACGNSCITGPILNSYFATLVGSIGVLTDTNAWSGVNYGNLNGAVDVRIYGAVCDGTTDDAAAINSALTAAGAIKGKVQIPRGKTCRASATIAVPYYTELDLGGYNPAGGVYPDPGGGIVCDAGVSPCVSLGSADVNAPTMLTNGTVTHAGGQPAAGVVNIMIYGYHDTIRDVLSDNGGICYKFYAHVGGGSGGISAHVYNASGQRCSDAYIDVANWPEVYWFGGRMGTNGSYDYASNTYVRVENPNGLGPGSAGTVVFTGVQFNSGNGYLAVTHFWEFVNFATTVPTEDATDFQVIGGHIENLATTANGGAVFYSDATVNQLSRVKLSASTINAPDTTLWALNPATGISDWDLTGDILLTGPSSLNPSAALGTFGSAATGINGLRITGGSLLYPITLTGPAGLNSNATIVGNQMSRGGHVINGVWSQFNAYGNTIGCITNNISSGSYSIDDACDGRNSNVGQFLFDSSNKVFGVGSTANYANNGNFPGSIVSTTNGGSQVRSTIYNGGSAAYTAATTNWSIGVAGAYTTCGEYFNATLNFTCQAGAGNAGGIVLDALNLAHAPVNILGSQVNISAPLNVSSLPSSAGGGGLYVCADSNGNLYRKASCP